MSIFEHIGLGLTVNWKTEKKNWIPFWCYALVVYYCSTTHSTDQCYYCLLLF